MRQHKRACIFSHIYHIYRFDSCVFMLTCSVERLPIGTPFLFLRTFTGPAPSLMFPGPTPTTRAPMWCPTLALPPATAERLRKVSLVIVLFVGIYGSSRVLFLIYFAYAFGPECYARTYIINVKTTHVVGLTA